MTALLISWITVTVVLMVLVVVRRLLESREQDWIPLTSTAPSQIQEQEQIERKVHVLTPVVHWVEALDVLLLAILAALWIYQGINSVRW